MPFQSEKQRRYLHANHPEIAKRWERDYGDGGVAKLNAQLNQLPEYYLPAAKGGIATHFKKRVKLKDSIESISDEEFKMMYPDWDPTQFSKEDYLQYISENQGNGVLDLSSDDQPIEFASTETDEIIPDLLAPGSASGVLNFAKDGGRIGFQYGSPHEEAAASRAGTHAGENRAREERQRDDHWQQTAGQSYVAPVETVAPTRDDDKRPLTGPQEGWTEEEVKIAVAEGERKAELKRLALQSQREKTEEWEKTQDWKPPESGVKKFFKTVALTLIPGLLPAELGKFWTAGTKIANYRAGEYDKYLIGPASKFRSDGEYAKEVEKAIKEHVEKMKLINSLPIGHPERILLEESLDYGPYKTTGDEDDGDEGPIVDPITLEVDEEYAQGEDGYPGFSLADMRAKQALNAQLQQKWAAEQEAYDQLYLGANSGGLANLFRVKNKY